MGKKWIAFNFSFSAPIQQPDQSFHFVWGLGQMQYLFPDEYTILATRGFWDFAYGQGLTVRTPIVIYGVLAGQVLPAKFEQSLEFTDYPDPLSNDEGQDYFLYEPLVRITTGTAQSDPPFYSRGKRKVHRAEHVFLSISGFVQGQSIRASVVGAVTGRLLIQH